MDEATPHLHIDFVPFTTGSKRGLDTRVSLKLALAELGFVGGSKHDTEWNQWVNAEKEELTKVMERYNVKRLDKGEHREHLSVYEFKCEQRKEEVKALDNEIDGLKEEKVKAEKELSDVEKETSEAKNRLSELEKEEKELSTNEAVYRDSAEYKLPKKDAFQSNKSYIEEKIKPFIEKLISIICAFCRKVQKLEKTIKELILDRDNYIARYRSASDALEQYRKDLHQLDKIRSELGDKKVNEIIDRYDKKQEEPAEREYIQRQSGRGRKDYDISR
jgi:chromosome segregation ATPase